MLNGIKISVIIPIYKTEAYLRDCIDSVLAQTQDGVQILLIDDRSPDGCPKICDEYAENHLNVKAIHRAENGGLAAVRNDGVAMSDGDYIMMLDSDDMLDGNNVLSVLYEKALSSDADIITGNYRYLYDSGLSKVKQLGILDTYDRNSEAFRFRGFYSGGHLSYTWAKLYRRSFLLKYHIENPPYRFTQDKLFNCYCYLHGASYAFVQESIIRYRVHGASVTFRYKEYYGVTWLDIGRDFERYADEVGYPDDVFDIAAYHVLFGALFVAKQEYLHAKGKRIAAMREALKAYGADELTQRAVSALASGKYTPPSLLLRMEVSFVSKRLAAQKYTLLSLALAVMVRLKKI